jgi:alpha-L-fucosidase 2
MGPPIDNQIIRELFGHVITASRVLGVDAGFMRSLEARSGQVPPAGQISGDGRLMEWLQDYKETDVHHRHISHLYGLYPASLITPEGTPALAEACKKTLDARGDDGPSWSIAYKILFWARLHDGNRALQLMRTILRPTLRTDVNYGSGGGVYPNLLSAGPPFQIDGNFGACAGVAEMLLQSHAGFIDLLPALPDAWRGSGEVMGLKAEGNYTVDFRWKDGKIIRYRVRAPHPGKVKLRVNGRMQLVNAETI